MARKKSTDGLRIILADCDGQRVFDPPVRQLVIINHTATVFFVRIGLEPASASLFDFRVGSGLITITPDTVIPAISWTCAGGLARPYAHVFAYRQARFNPGQS